MRLERFDYRGTGEAAGQFEEVTLGSLRRDVRDQINGDEICLIGLRFGASLAFDYCQNQCVPVKHLILLEPVIDGKEYVRYLRCQQHIKDTMTGAVDTSRDARFENIGGYCRFQ